MANEYWDDYEHVDKEFEGWWTSRAKEAPLIDVDADPRYISRIKDLARNFFHSGYEQKRREVAESPEFKAFVELYRKAPSVEEIKEL